MTDLRAWINKDRITKVRCVLAIALLLAIISAFSPSCMTRAEGVATRAASMMPFDVKSSKNIAIIAIDRASIEQFGEWPWKRNDSLKLIRATQNAGAKIIVIPPEMVKSLKNILPSKSPTAIIAEYRFRDNDKKLDRMKRKNLGKIAFPNTPEFSDDLLEMGSPELGRIRQKPSKSLAYGFANIFPDGDGVVRTQPLAVMFDGKAFPATEIATTAIAKDFTPTIKENSSGKASGISLGEMDIPTPSDLSIVIDYRHGALTFDHFSARDFLNKKLDKKFLSGRIALIGVTDRTSRAWYATPLAEMSGVEIKANVLENIMDGSWITSFTGPISSPIFIMLLGIFFAVIVRRNQFTTQLRISGATLIGVWAIGLSLEAYASIRIPVIFLSIAITIFQSSLLLWHLFMEEMPKIFLRRYFSGKLNQSATDAIAKNPKLVKAGRGDVVSTALAIDIRGFSRISAKLPPKKLSVFLGEYRDVISKILLAENAMVESWTGDECRAFFNIPIPLANHQRRACSAALKIKKAIRGRRPDWKKRFGVDHIRIGIGIHSGRVHLETKGRSHVMELSITGSTVEVATRLRTLTRIYGTSILTSNTIEGLAQHAFAFRGLDALSFGGEKKSVIHELMGNLGLILPQMNDFMIARRAYKDGDYDRAAKLFTEILDVYPNDGPSALLKKRALEKIK